MRWALVESECARLFSNSFLTGLRLFCGFAALVGGYSGSIGGKTLGAHNDLDVNCIIHVYCLAARLLCLPD